MIGSGGGGFVIGVGTLLLIAVTLIVLLGAVAWFMFKK